MTVQELLELPVSFPLDTANRALALRRSTGYALARRGEYPVRVLRVGSTYRVSRSELLSYLGIDPGTQSSSPGPATRAA
ncbi:integrase [Streptomyces armeniacus]|uniref:Integrase n=1 Tax=Streptomyces armeniacus TaxID=83291 RepID=A0A345Y1N2_9ACTN|nr:integrase [Streptomyces armeniacus]AXK37798.1 integrase [Streptomyces armeniacus]